MGSHPSQKAATADEDLSPNSPLPSHPQPAPTLPQCQLEFHHLSRVTCDHGWNDGPVVGPANRELFSDEGEDEDAISNDHNNLTPAPSTNFTVVDPAIIPTTFSLFLELPTEVQMLIFRHAVETSIGPVRKDDEFRSDLWYTETSLFSSGCTNYPHYMTYHNGGVGCIISPQFTSAEQRWVGIGSKVIFKDIMHSNRLGRYVVLEYWREAVGKCLGEYVRADEERKGMDGDGRPINYWMMRALKRRELVLEVLGLLLKGMRSTGGGE